MIVTMLVTALLHPHDQLAQLHTPQQFGAYVRMHPAPRPHENSRNTIPRDVTPTAIPAVWQALAQCESGGDFADTAGGFEGGFQFLQSTWLNEGGGVYAEHAYDATPLEQLTVARRTLASGGPTQWPVCSRIVGLTRENGL